MNKYIIHQRVPDSSELRYLLTELPLIRTCLKNSDVNFRYAPIAYLNRHLETDSIPQWNETNISTIKATSFHRSHKVKPKWPHRPRAGGLEADGLLWGKGCGERWGSLITVGRWNKGALIVQQLILHFSHTRTHTQSWLPVTWHRH